MFRVAGAVFVIWGLLYDVASGLLGGWGRFLLRSVKVLLVWSYVLVLIIHLLQIIEDAGFEMAIVSLHLFRPLVLESSCWISDMVRYSSKPRQSSMLWMYATDSGHALCGLQAKMYFIKEVRLEIVGFC